MINSVNLTGRLTAEPELKYTQSGTAVLSFSLAVSRPFTNQNGERESDFIHCVMWRKNAENFANWTHKGSLVGVSGRIQTRSYENQQGTRVYVTEVMIERFAFLESKNNGQNNNYQNNKQETNTNNYNQINSNQQLNNNQQSFNSQGQQNNSQSVQTTDARELFNNDINSEELPF